MKTIIRILSFILPLILGIWADVKIYDFVISSIPVESAALAWIGIIKAVTVFLLVIWTGGLILGISALIANIVNIFLD